MEPKVKKSKSITQIIKNKNQSKKKHRTLKILAIALYITFLLLSTIPFMADRTVEPYMKESYEYHLRYPRDGRQTHYYVERADKSEIGKIDLTYTTSTNSLNVETTNIEVLHIFCRSMYEDECRDVYGIDPSDNSNFYKWYFIEKNHFIVSIESDHKIKELSFIDMPVPYQVIVNGLKWFEGRQYNYTNNYGVVLSHVPSGLTHVDIYFKTNDNNKPYAQFTADKTITNIDTLINFNASKSGDIDGEIIAYIWDFGDGSNSGGVLNAHSYSEPGIYGVILTVRDNDFLIDQAFMNITVVKGSNRPVINGIVPNQIKEEDSPPWELDLSGFGIDLDSSPTELRWYITGENTSLYQVVGENSTDQKIIFTPKKNAYGNDLVRLYLKDKDGYNTSQSLWVNITPVNDKPIIENLPGLVVHYNVPYEFHIYNYISDVETPKNKLVVAAQDKFGNKYVHIKEKIIVFMYPEELMDEVILTTVTVSDGEDSSEAIISVTVSKDWPPILIDPLPDVVLYEGSVVRDVFNLSHYFTDPDGEKLYYSYTESNVIIYIKTNHSVDIISQGEWTGEEEVVFRARDSFGAFMEDIIKITVLPINDPPEIGEVPDVMVHFDMDYNFDVSYYIWDIDNSPSELTLTTSDPKHIRINPNNHLALILYYPKSLLGITTKVKLTVSDGQLETSKTISVYVIAEYPPELVQKMPDITFNEDDSLVNFFNLDEYFLDYDNDSLYYTTGNVMIKILIDESHLVSFHSEPDWFGTEQVVFRATDPIGAFVEAPILVTVLPVNDAPVLAPLPNVTLNKTEIFELELANYISDVDTNMSNINIIVEDPNIMVSGTSLIIFGSPDLNDEIEIYITDGELVTVGMLRVKVNSDDAGGEINNIAIILSIIILIIIIIIILSLMLYYYRKQQKFEIEELFLIHNSGKLLNHIYYKTHSKFDDEIFSGMFTAIQQFIEDSFSRENLPSLSTPVSVNSLTRKQSPSDQPLKLNEFKVGNNQVIIEHGRFLFMAVVYNGAGSGALHRIIKHSIRYIEKKYGEYLEYWNGDMTHLKKLHKYLIKLIPKAKLKKQEENKSGDTLSSSKS